MILLLITRKTFCLLAFYLEEVALNELSAYTEKLSFIWYELGLRLGLDAGKLDTINLAIGDHEERCLKMLELWKETEGPVPHNWESFLNALRSGQSDIEHSIANDIYNSFSIKVSGTKSYRLYENLYLF